MCRPRARHDVASTQHNTTQPITARARRGGPGAVGAAPVSSRASGARLRARVSRMPHASALRRRALGACRVRGVGPFHILRLVLSVEGVGLALACRRRARAARVRGARARGASEWRCRVFRVLSGAQTHTHTHTQTHTHKITLTQTQKYTRINTLKHQQTRACLPVCARAYVRAHTCSW